MKKLIAAIATLALMTLGLVAVSGGAASAGTEYPGTVDTSTVASGNNVKKGSRVKTKVNVTSASDAPEVGSVKITWKRVNGGFSKTITFEYAGGGAQTFTGPKLRKRGKYKGTAKYIPNDGSIFKSSSDTYTFKVVRR